MNIVEEKVNTFTLIRKHLEIQALSASDSDYVQSAPVVEMYTKTILDTIQFTPSCFDLEYITSRVNGQRYMEGYIKDKRLICQDSSGADVIIIDPLNIRVIEEDEITVNITSTENWKTEKRDSFFGFNRSTEFVESRTYNIYDAEDEYLLYTVTRGRDASKWNQVYVDAFNRNHF